MEIIKTKIAEINDFRKDEIPEKDREKYLSQSIKELKSIRKTLTNYGHSASNGEINEGNEALQRNNQIARNIKAIDYDCKLMLHAREMALNFPELQFPVHGVVKTGFEAFLIHKIRNLLNSKPVGLEKEIEVISYGSMKNPKDCKIKNISRPIIMDKYSRYAIAHALVFEFLKNYENDIKELKRKMNVRKNIINKYRKVFVPDASVYHTKDITHQIVDEYCPVLDKEIEEMKENICDSITNDVRREIIKQELQYNERSNKNDKLFSSLNPNLTAFHIKKLSIENDDILNEKNVSKLIKNRKKLKRYDGSIVDDDSIILYVKNELSFDDDEICNALNITNNAESGLFFL